MEVQSGDQPGGHHCDRPEYDRRQQDALGPVAQVGAGAAAVQHHRAEVAGEHHEQHHPEQMDHEHDRPRQSGWPGVDHHPRGLRQERHQRVQHDSEQQGTAAQGIQTVQPGGTRRCAGSGLRCGLMCGGGAAGGPVLRLSRGGGGHAGHVRCRSGPGSSPESRIRWTFRWSERGRVRPRRRGPWCPRCLRT